MNKAELISKVAETVPETEKVSQKQIEAVLDGFRDVVTSSVTMGDEVSYPGLGKFSRVSREARMARNPRTGESVPVPASNAPKFTPSTKFKAVVKG